MAITTEILKDGGTTEAAIKSFYGGDDHVNEEPIHDATEDIDAVKFNKHGKGLAELTKRARPGNLVTIAFELGTTPASATTPVPRMGSTLTGWLAHIDGTIVGITGRFESALTGGTAIVQPKIAGTDTDLSLSLTGLQANRARQVPGERGADDTIDASLFELLEVDVTTSGATWAGSDGLIVDVVISCGEEEDI